METSVVGPVRDRGRDRLGVTWALLVARLVLGAVFIAHGSQKLLGAFGGPGLAGPVRMLGPVGYLVAVAEFFGGIGLVTGLLSRFSAFWLIVEMIGAIALVHGKNGFFLGAKLGFEFNLALIGLLATVLLAGPGELSLGRWLPWPYRTLLE